MLRDEKQFTMIELLVVIVIISILATMLLPVLSVARKRSRAISCVNNMKQIATGLILYGDEFDGFMVPGRLPADGVSGGNYEVGNGERYRPRWYCLIGIAADFYPYDTPASGAASADNQQIDNDLFLCPQEPEMSNCRNYPYGYNYQFLGNARGGSGDYINWPLRRESVNAPSSTVSFADCMGTAAGKAASARKPYDEDMKNGLENLSGIGNNAWALDPPRLIVGSSDFCDSSNRGAAHRSAIDPRHLGGANVAFCDGHVESQNLLELGYALDSDGSVDVNGTNKYFSGSGGDEDPPDIN